MAGDEGMEGQKTSGKKVVISVTGIQYPPEELREVREGACEELREPEQSAVVTRTRAEAEYYRRGETHYLIYEELFEGEVSLVKTRVKYRDGYMEMSRKGGMFGVGYRMVFEPGKVFRTDYPTPFGSLTLDVVTRGVELQEHGAALQERGTELQECGTELQDAQTVCPAVKVDYVLENAGRQMGVYELKIEREG